MPNLFSQAHFVSDDLQLALDTCSEEIKQELPESIDLLVVFVAGFTPEQFETATAKLQSSMNATTVIGCSCETAIGGSHELEQEKAVTLWAAKLENADVIPIHLTYQRASGETAFVGWPDEVDGEWPDDSVLLVFSEPFGFPMDVLLERFNEDRPDVRIVGGIASGAYNPGEARLLLNDKTFNDGLVAVRISGPTMKAVVSQGCRPIGQPMVVTQSERNVIETLGGKPAFNVVRELFQTLPTKDQKMVQSGLHLGIVINEYQEKFEYGDFLIRNVIGIDEDSHAISVGDYVRMGQTVQFHIRDHESASAELDGLLSQAIGEQPYAGGLLFTCNGRGLNMFPEPHHDAMAVQAKTQMPLAGFFAAGEIGPIGSKNFLHGFTASLLLFSE